MRYSISKHKKILNDYSEKPSILKIPPPPLGSDMILECSLTENYTNYTKYFFIKIYIILKFSIMIFERKQGDCNRSLKSYESIAVKLFEV